MKKKILITTDCFLPRWDGIARFLSEIIPDLKKHFDITVIAPEFGGKPYKEQDVKIIKLPIYNIKFGDIYFSKIKYKLIKQEVLKAEIIFNQTIGPIGMCSIFAASERKPIISYVHSIEWELASEGVKYFKKIVKILVKKLAKYLYNKCDLLLVPSKELKELLEISKIKTKKEIVFLGVDTKKFFPTQDKNQAKEKIGIKPNQFVIGFVGRFGREKDLKTLYKAFIQIHKNNHKTTLLLVGKGEFYKHKNIIITGPTRDVTKYLQAMDIFILPSLTETSSLSTMEAMACELPVIVTPVGNIKKYVKENVNGMFFPNKNDYNIKEYDD